MGDDCIGFYYKRARQKEKSVVLDKVNQKSDDNKKIFQKKLGKGVKYYFETELLDYALFLGMSFDDFWFSDPHILDNYEKAYEAKRKQEYQGYWIQGAYVKAAIESSVFVAGLANKKVLRGMPKYPDNPFKSEEDAVKNVEEERQKLYMFLKNLKVRR